MGIYKDVAGERMEGVERELKSVKASFYNAIFLDNFLSYIYFLRLVKDCVAVHLFLALN